MSAEKLREYLIQNPEEIVKILEVTDFHSISFFDNKKEIRCAYYEGGNHTSVAINCETLQTYVFSKGIGGDLFYIISLHNNWSMSQTLNLIYKILNIKDINELDIPFIFEGFYKKISTFNKQDKENILPVNTLNRFVNHPSVRFAKDNISYLTQYKFKIKYDTITNRVIVPWFNKRGDLVGITGRYNFNDIGNNPKWKAIENFPKGNYLYGLYENQKEIEEMDYVIIGESEKFVMQLDSYGYHNGLALGNCTITDKQARIIKSLPVKKIIIALDEGVNIEHILAQCEKLKGGIFNNNKEIWCIYDNENKVIPKGSKASPTDFGKEKLEYLLKNCCFRKE